MEQQVARWSTHEAAAAWGVSERRVRQLCAAGRVPGAVLFGYLRRGTWFVPVNAPKPDDEQRGRRSFPRVVS